MKDGCIMANSGHFNVEINKQDMEQMAVSTKMLKPDIEEFVMMKSLECFYHISISIWPQQPMKKQQYNKIHIFLNLLRDL
jgi:hypothetical protein